jgi:hypothetical protein
MNHPHVVTDPDATAYTPPPPPTPDVSTAPGAESTEAAEARAVKEAADALAAELAWLQLSSALTDQAPAIADRDDLTVTIAPGAGHGAPGCFIATLASIELDSATLTDHGIDPATCTPERVSDRDRYAPTWGVLTHECAHARHSTWDFPANASGSGSALAASASMMLEESRIEAAHLTRRPGDRRWLRASATDLILPNMITLQAADQPDEAPEAPTAPAAPETTESPAPAPGEVVAAEPTTPPSTTPAPTAPMSAWTAAHAAGLLLARVDAGVLDEDEVAAVTDTITPILGTERLATLRDIWRAAHETGDDDAETMIRLGRDWCHALDLDPDGADPTEGIDPADARDLLSPLTAAVITALGAVRTNDAPDETPDPAPARHAAREAETDAREASHRAASAVFGSRGTARSGGKTAISGTRKPTEGESAAARRLARALREAGSRERIAVTTTSATPPGRLSMRGAMAVDAQRAAGATPTAEPFTRTTRRHVPTPPLRIAIACDVSASMKSAAPAIASTAWILNRATGFVTDAKAATVIFGQHVRPITRPGQVPAEVTEFEANDGTEQVTRAIDALDAALDLTRRDAARLLVIVSDGNFTYDELITGQRRIDRLRAAGCAVLWIALNGYSSPMAGVTSLILHNPATAADAIARAATDALRHA